jgi:hypothetical protein
MVLKEPIIRYVFLLGVTKHLGFLKGTAGMLTHTLVRAVE